MLAYLITEPELSTAGPLDATLDAEVSDERFLAQLAYEATGGTEERRWLPSRRRPSACGAEPLA
jgi:hypothetical protein